LVQSALSVPSAALPVPPAFQAPATVPVTAGVASVPNKASFPAPPCADSVPAAIPITSAVLSVPAACQVPSAAESDTAGITGTSAMSLAPKEMPISIISLGDFGSGGQSPLNIQEISGGSDKNEYQDPMVLKDNLMQQDYKKEFVQQEYTEQQDDFILPDDMEQPEHEVVGKDGIVAWFDKERLDSIELQDYVEKKEIIENFVSGTSEEKKEISEDIHRDTSLQQPSIADEDYINAQLSDDDLEFKEERIEIGGCTQDDCAADNNECMDINDLAEENEDTLKLKTATGCSGVKIMLSRHEVRTWQSRSAAEEPRKRGRPPKIKTIERSADDFDTMKPLCTAAEIACDKKAVCPHCSQGKAKFVSCCVWYGTLLISYFFSMRC
jgi:hypothetical protein